ncbi:Ig-like domain-containing protein, partial [Pedobacter gandavensis]
AGGAVVLKTTTLADSYQWYKGLSLITGATQQTYTATESGSYSVKITSIACESPASNPIAVTVNPIPDAAVITAEGQTTVCAGGAVVLKSTTLADSYQWYKGLSLITGATQQTYTATENGNYTVKITSIACESPASNPIAVTVNPIPDAAEITAEGQTAFCAGGAVVLKTTTVADGYQWYKGLSLITGATQQTYTATESGNYTVKITSIACESPASNPIAVTVNPIPDAAVITAEGQTTVCAGGAVVLKTTTLADSYQWYKGLSLITGATQQTYTATESGNYSVKITSIACESPASNPITVTVNPIPDAAVITAEGQTTFCAGGAVVLKTTTLADSYQWYKGLNLITGATQQTYTATESGNYTVKITSIACESPASNPIAVTVNPIPDAAEITAEGQTTFCAGGAVVLKTTTLADSYQWYKGLSLITGATQQTYTATESGNYSVKITSIACESPASNPITVTVNPIPDAVVITAEGQTTFCAGGAVVLKTTTLADSYQWYKGLSLITGATQQTYTATESGSYTVKITSIACESPASNPIAVTVNPIPDAVVITAEGQTTFCAGGAVVLKTTTVADSYQWYKGLSLITGATQPTYTATESGSYTVKITSIACESPASNPIEVTVNPIPDAVVITAEGQTTFCAGGAVVLKTTTVADSYQWYKGLNLITGATQQTYTATESGSYTVKITSIACESPASNPIAVTVNPIPDAVVITAEGQTTVCAGGSVLLKTTTVADSYQWYKGLSLITGATQQTYTATESGSYTVKITSTACESPASNPIVVTVNPIPDAVVITAEGQTTFCAGGAVVLKSTTLADSYQWYKGLNLITGATEQTYTATESGNYSVKITSIACESPASNPIAVTVNPIPDAAVITAEGQTTFCAGGAVVLKSTTLADSYQWYKGLNLITGATQQTYTATESGNYTVKITSIACESPASNPIVVTVNPIPDAVVITAEGQTTFCAGGAVVLKTTTLADSYQWYKGLNLITGATQQTYTATESGNYSVKITSIACESPASNPITVTVNPIPDAVVITAEGQTTFCAGGTVVLKTTTLADSYQWYKGLNLITGATEQTYTATESGNYSVKITSIACESPASNALEVVVNPIPDAAVITAEGQTTFCAGGAVVLKTTTVA